MGQMKISEMQLAQQVNKEDYIPIVQGGANKKISAENLMDYNAMKNKPRINGKELSSENSLDYLEIQPKGNYVTKEEFNANDFATAAEVEKKLDKNLGKENSQKILQISESGEVKAVDAVGENNVVYKSEVAEPAIINDSFNKVNRGIEIYGQSVQASTTGTQLLSLDMTESKLPYSVNGITFSDNGDGGIKVTGTATEVTTLYFNDMINNLEDGETYSYNSDTKLGTLAVSYNDGTPTDYIKMITVNKSKMISIKPYMQYASGNTVNKVIYPMLNIGNSVKPWEPYTGGKPSPSPDYPQEIKNEEISEISVCNGNLISLIIDAYSTSEEVYLYQNLGFTLQKGIKYVLSAKEVVTALYAIPFGSTSPDDSPFKNYNSDTVEFTPAETGKYYFHAYSQNGMTDGQKILWLNVGEKKPYIEHIEEKVTFSSPITLRGIPVSSDGNVTIDGQQYISDVIKEKDGVIGVERNVESFSLLIKDMNNNSNYPGWRSLDVVDKILPPQANDTQISNTLCTIQSRTIYARRDTKLLYLSSEILGKTQAELIEQYPDLSVDFAAISYEPTFEPLPEEVQDAIRALQMYYPTTIVDCGAPVSVTYEASLQTIFEDLTSKINESINLSNKAILYNKD